MDLLAPALARIADVESAAADALAPVEEVLVDGWRLRFNRGVTRRGNSVLPEQRGRLPLARKIREAEAWFRERRVPPRMQIAPSARPRRLDAELEARGWRREAGARVLYRSVLGASDRPLLQQGDDPAVVVTIGDDPSEGYRSVQDAVTPGAAAWARHRARALRAGGLDPWHVVLVRDGAATSSGLAVHDPRRRLVGVFSLATVPAERGRGDATRLLRAMRAAAARAGADGLYLQVDARNDGAARLYGREGFAEHHRYDYRVAPGP